MKTKTKSKGNSERRKRQKTAKVENETSENLKGEVLDIKNLREGMVVLGCVTEVRSHCLLVSLPGCLVGKVPLANISAKYTETIVQSDQEEAADLSTIVEVGATYPFKVMEVAYKEKLKKPLIVLSMDPQVVNSELRLQSLYLKMVLHGAVTSVEDHGYIVEVGVPSVQGFLPFSGCSGDRTLSLGQVVGACVRKLPNDTKGNNVVWLSKLNNTQEQIEDDKMKLTSILPGAYVTAYITEIKQPFIYMKCMSFDACASMMSLGSSNQNLSDATKVSGTVLYVHPVSHVIYLLLGPKPTPDSFRSFFPFEKFDLVNNLKYLYYWHHRLILKMKNKGALGFVKKGELPDKGSLSRDSLGKNPVIPKGRVVYLHYMDNLVELSLHESSINMEIIKPEEVQIGDIYEGTVTKHVENGMFVAICPGFSGFVRNIHLSDSLVTMPDKLYPVGAKVKCRVLSVNGGSFNLSTKESTLRVDPNDLLVDYEQAKKGSCFKGVIVHKANTHVVVLFFNDVKGVVPADEIPESSVLFVGQTVSCRVLQSDPSHHKLKLSLKSDASTKSSSKIPKLPKMDAEASLAEGKFDPRKKQRAIIQSKTDQQLKIVLDGGLRGRVHITEIGNAEEGSLPLKGWKPFQRIGVHVLGTYERRGVNHLDVSHRRTETFLECSLHFPSPAPLHREYLQGMDVTAYVREASNTSCTLWLSPNQTATLDYLHISENPKVLRKLKKQLKIGLAVNAQVLKVEKKSKDSYSIMLTKLGVDSSLVGVGRNVVGLVQMACPEKGVVVRLCHGYHGRVSLCDIQDILPAHTLAPALEKCRRMLFVLCHVLEVNRDTKFCTLSLRKTRLYGQKLDESKDVLPELTASTLEKGIRVKGFVKMTHNDSIVVNFGRLLDGQVQLHRCGAYGCTFCAHSKEAIAKQEPGSVIEVVVDGTAPSKGLYPLSLPGMEGMGLSQQSRLTVTEDIDWDES